MAAEKEARVVNAEEANEYIAANTNLTKEEAEIATDAYHDYLESIGVAEKDTVSESGKGIVAESINPGEIVSMSSEGLTVKLNVDVADALTGLKAVQREAKMATRAVAELGETDKASIRLKNHAMHPDFVIAIDDSTGKIVGSIDALKGVPTADLVEELSRREGVSADYKIYRGSRGTVKTCDGDRSVVNGPARILAVRT
ncbi:hypothetical protein J26TS2_00670 [Shouchella clausii]|nr:hypothetical protein J26TS2_00670 [Shouchella clausii]